MSRQISIRGICVLVGLIAIFLGREFAWNIITNLITNIWDFFCYLPRLVKPFTPFLGLEEKIISRIVFGVITAITIGLGIFLTNKTKKKLWIFVSGIVEIVFVIINY